ncbi:MAG: hypothetical protein JKY92_06115 [Magnetovibrio sp.]|nr:hypothetical protein [Magnetovibrio sp.]
MLGPSPSWAGEKKDITAIVDAASRYLKGDGVDKNIGEAWYWLKRGQQEKFDTSFVTKKSMNQLLEEMSLNERQTLAYLAHYHNDLDINGIDIPSLFKPLSATPPQPLTGQDVSYFIKKFIGLNRKSDSKAYNLVERELVTRTAGIRYIGNVSIDGQIRPFGMSNEEFVQRKCNYHRAIGKIFPQGRDKIGHQLRSQNEALSSLFKESASRYVNDVLQAGRFCPNPESKAITNALVWAKRLDQLGPAALREYAQNHFEKSGSVSKTRYKPPAHRSRRDTELDRLMHFLLSKTLLKFAALKEQEK